MNRRSFIARLAAGLAALGAGVWPWRKPKAEPLLREGPYSHPKFGQFSAPCDVYVNADSRFPASLEIGADAKEGDALYIGASGKAYPMRSPRSFIASDLIEVRVDHIDEPLEL